MVDLQECVENGGNQDGAAGVYLGGLAERRVIRLASLGIRSASNRSAKRSMHPGGFAELARHVEERVVELQAAASPADLRFHNSRDGEMLQQRHQVCEGFVEGQLVGVGGIVEVAVDTVEDGVCGLMGNDVVGETGERNAAGIEPGWIGGLRFVDRVA